MFDRNRVTGGGVTAGIDFALALTAAIRGEEHARLVQLSLEYDPAPPFDSGSPERADAGEISACRWWYEQERLLVKPAVTVALGATAARQMLGRVVTIGKTRGQPLDLPDGGRGWVTIHPSFLLRMPDKSRAEDEFAAFVADLKGAAKLLG